MIALSLGGTPFTPAWYLDQAGAPRPEARTYLVRPGTITDRAMFEGALAGPPWHAGRVFPWDLLDAAERAAKHLLEGDAQGQVLEALAATRAHMSDPENIPVEASQLLASLEVPLCHWPEYAELRAAEARRRHALPVLAAKWFLTGWTGLEQPFEKGMDGRPTDAALQAIPAPDLAAVGWHAYGLLYAEQHRPLSQPPSTSGGTPQPSTTAAAPRQGKAGGKSPARSGRKTRA